MFIYCQQKLQSIANIYLYESYRKQPIIGKERKQSGSCVSKTMTRQLRNHSSDSKVYLTRGVNFAAQHVILVFS